ncbi:DUF262 and DUF1524 domain-containing protein [Bengtsoniella intestinalis]|uniref:GmrSD restriction endonuclease domain-containing protein n=1 Tax=Bengtsoniella intestinalis TaxID=3073143 RepID=UPI00391EECAE
MDAKKGNIFEVLNSDRQFIIPVYQRIYSWEISQCKKLWQDIVDMQKKGRVGHFVGSIVNIAEQVMPTGVQKYMIIDGQQRMATLTILLVALRDYVAENQDSATLNSNMITDKYLKNTYQQGDDNYKLLLTKADRDTLIELIDKIPNANKDSKKIIDNYDFFKSKIESKELEPSQIYEAVGKLQLVNITLDRSIDDPQLIFESLNSTGMDLSQSDLIRNHILMGLDNEVQTRVYDRIWHPMEKMFGYDKQSDLMDKFFRDYLTFKNARIPNQNKVYDEFQLYHKNSIFSTVDEFCGDVFQKANFYTNIVFAKSEYPELNALFSEVKTLQMDVIYPFFIKVYSDFAENKITVTDFVAIVKMCISYIVRRAICGIPTNSLNKTFATLKNSIKADDYLNSIKLAFVTMDSYKAFPTNIDFSISLALKDIYNMRIRNYILGKMESHQNKSPIIVSNYTIEHIMPQNPNLSMEWKSCLGEDLYKEVRTKYLHTIGNLTLTAYNPEMSDRSFNEKLNMVGGFKESGLRLNSFLIHQTTWNKDLILERADILCNLCKDIWEYPYIDEDVIAAYEDTKKEKSVYTLASYEYLNDFTKKLYEMFDKRVMNISPDIKKEFKKLYIAYKAETNFVDVVIQKSRLRLSINMKFNDVIDLKGICRDVTALGRWGNGDIEIAFDNIDQIDDIMDIVEQSYNKQLD